MTECHGFLSSEACKKLKFLQDQMKQQIYKKNSQNSFTTSKLYHVSVYINNTIKMIS